MKYFTYSAQQVKFIHTYHKHTLVSFGLVHLWWQKTPQNLYFIETVELNSKDKLFHRKCEQNFRISLCCYQIHPRAWCFLLVSNHGSHGLAPHTVCGRTCVEEVHHKSASGQHTQANTHRPLLSMTDLSAAHKAYLSMHVHIKHNWKKQQCHHKMSCFQFNTIPSVVGLGSKSTSSTLTWYKTLRQAKPAEALKEEQMSFGSILRSLLCCRCNR